MRWNKVRSLLGIAVACASVSANRASATIYTVDSSQSYLTLAVYASGVPLTAPQFAGADTTSLGGTVDATVGGGNVTFGATTITFANQSTAVLPGPGGGVPSAGTVNILPDNPGSGTGNYGMVLIVPSDPGDPLQWLNLDTSQLAGYADIANALASLTGSVAIGGGVFSPNGLTVSTTAGDLEYNLNQAGDGAPNFGDPFLNGTTGIAPNNGLIAGAPNGSIIGNTIIIPILVDVPVDTGLFIVDAVFSGQIVATAVPEPSTFALAGLGLVALVPVIRRRLRKA